MRADSVLLFLNDMTGFAFVEDAFVLCNITCRKGCRRQQHHGA
jgi:hypothetical protein